MTTVNPDSSISSGSRLGPLYRPEVYPGSEARSALWPAAVAVIRT